MSYFPKKLKTVVYLLLITIIVIIAIDYFMSIYTREREEINQKFIIPPEFMNGDTLYIGDSFERISKYITMEQNWYTDGLSRGRKYREGSYHGDRGFLDIQFNYKNKLIYLELGLMNTDSLPVDKYFAKIGKILIKYYGRDFKIYTRDKFKSARQLVWDLPDSMAIYFYGHIDSKELNREDSNGAWIDFAKKRYDSFYQLDTVNTAKSLGLE